MKNDPDLFGEKMQKGFILGKYYFDVKNLTSKHVLAKRVQS